ncbi:hypothetical protein NDU88_009686 [Pleurodeles waltl]|uniref:Uncharacterized protein n=1 Tax=Pleurodeles waltl TaxID=8319 RepID=A0AAV7RZR1_PLEWA|nr:hypothetical protein NDU88_009686 [Pleurodeles waltl]
MPSDRGPPIGREPGPSQLCKGAAGTPNAHNPHLSTARLPGSPAPRAGGGRLATLPCLQVSDYRTLVSQPAPATSGLPLPSVPGGESFLGVLGSPKATDFVLSAGLPGCQDYPGFTEEILHAGGESSGITS